jgi:hypothetical protein
MHDDVGPAAGKSIERVLSGYVEGVLIGLIDFGEGFDQIDGVGLVAAELSSD